MHGGNIQPRVDMAVLHGCRVQAACMRGYSKRHSRVGYNRSQVRCVRKCTDEGSNQVEGISAGGAEVKDTAKLEEDPIRSAQVKEASSLGEDMFHGSWLRKFPV